MDSTKTEIQNFKKNMSEMKHISEPMRPHIIVHNEMFPYKRIQFEAWIVKEQTRLQRLLTQEELDKNRSYFMINSVPKPREDNLLRTNRQSDYALKNRQSTNSA